MTHNAISGVAHFRTKDEKSASRKFASLFRNCRKRRNESFDNRGEKAEKQSGKTLRNSPEDHRAPYDMHEVLKCFLDDGEIDEFQADYAKEMICGTRESAEFLSESSPTRAECSAEK
jgi:acetyl-CoA carboxylase carboxyltransferase component